MSDPLRERLADVVWQIKFNRTPVKTCQVYRNCLAEADAILDIIAPLRELAEAVDKRFERMAEIKRGGEQTTLGECQDIWLAEEAALARCRELCKEHDDDG